MLKQSQTQDTQTMVPQTRKYNYFVSLVVKYFQLFKTNCNYMEIRNVSIRKKMFYLMMHSTHFIYGYMVSDIWYRTTQIVRDETRCRHMCYSFQLAARVLLYASFHRQHNTYHVLCYTSRGALAGMRYSSVGSPWRIDPMIHRTMSECSYHGATSRFGMCL